uniref:Phospholipid scramblase n=1 Tax=Latimeria chalumnae TaxID=7897 RepID=H2ZS00_LATCH
PLLPRTNLCLQLGCQLHPNLQACPPGLEYLTQIDQILIHQLSVEVFTGFEENSKFEIKNNLGQKVYFAAEENDCCNRSCCGSSRSFTIKVMDSTGRNVMVASRPLSCCLQVLEVQAPPGIPIGYVVQEWHPWLPMFTIQDERRVAVLKIVGPCNTCSYFSDVDFKVKALDGRSIVSKIRKQCTGLVRERTTNADDFGIQFPMDLDVKMKAVMVGACFLIDFILFK